MLPDAFRVHMAALAAQAGLQGSAAAMPGVVRRPWQLPATYPIPIDVQNPAGVKLACDRTDLNAACLLEYQQGLDPNEGRIGAVGALKTAIDYQAAYERALHARHASPVRLRVWAGGRRSGHQDTTYGIFGVIVRALDASISAAHSVPNTQDESPGD